MFNKTTLAILISLSLAACGGTEGEDSTPNPTPDPTDPTPDPTDPTDKESYTVRIIGSTDNAVIPLSITTGTNAEGYLSNARACYDLNLDGKCQDFTGTDGNVVVEELKYTDDNGYVELSYDKSINGSLLTEILDGNEVIYTLMAPNTYDVITAYSTLVDFEMKTKFLTLEQAEQAVINDIGFEFDTSVDFLANEMDNKVEIEKLSNTLIKMFEDFTESSKNTSPTTFTTYSSSSYNPLDVISGVNDSLADVSEEVIENPDATYEEIMQEASVDSDQKMEDIANETGTDLLNSVEMSETLRLKTHYQLDSNVDEANKVYNYDVSSYKTEETKDPELEYAIDFKEIQNAERFSDSIEYEAPYNQNWSSTSVRTSELKYLDKDSNWISIPSNLKLKNVDETALHLYINGNEDVVAFKMIVGEASISNKSFKSVLKDDPYAVDWLKVINNNATFGSGSKVLKKNKLAFVEMYELTKDAKLSDGSGNWTSLSDGQNTEFDLFPKIKNGVETGEMYTGLMNSSNELTIYLNGEEVKSNIPNTAENKYPNAAVEYAIPLEILKYLQKAKDGAAGLIFTEVSGQVKQGFILAPGALVGEVEFLYTENAKEQLKESLHNNYCSVNWSGVLNDERPTFCKVPEPENGGGSGGGN